MRMLYLGKVDFDNKSSGVTIKVTHQHKIFEDSGIRVDNLNTVSKKLWVKINNRFPVLFDFYSITIINHIKKNINYDVYYFRRFPVTRQMIKSMRRIRQNNPKALILVEIPTYPYDREISGLSAKLLLMIDKIYRVKLHKYADKILTYSKHDEIFRIPTIKLANGLNMDQISLSSHCESFNNTINAIAVAKMELWQGYDRFIEGLKMYYANPSLEPKRNIILHLVGEGNEIKKYKKMVGNYGLVDHVKFYGKQFGSKLDEIYDKCSIAVSSLAKHRINVYYDSVLKDKEYAAKGLPIISAVRTEFDDHKSFKYYKYFQSNENFINLHEFIDFYDSVYSDKCKITQQNIRNFAEENFDMKVVLTPVIDYIKSNSGM